MTDIYLAIDFGSTYTKLTAIDLKNEEVIATSRAITTIKTDILDGYNEAFKKIEMDLKNKLDNKYKIIKKVACSSAAGGLKIVAIGLVPELTTEAAKKAALSSGARVVKTYAFLLTDENIKELNSLEYDMILLTGGTNGGNREYILNNAKILLENRISKPIVVAGNEEVTEEIKEIFQKANTEFYISENVMPVVNKINVLPVKEVIREVFMKNIVKAKGMENVEKMIGEIIMPTPTAVMKATEIFSEYNSENSDENNIIVVDIGGATTDVHSIGKGLPKNNTIQLRGMEEPYSKRTVEGDLGMRYSSLALYEAASLNKIRAYLESKDSKVNIRENFKFRQDNPDFVADNEEDLIFDEMMAMICTEIAVNRHVGTLESIYSPMGTIFVQSGKDLTGVKYIIGTGGIINNNRDPRKILEKALFSEDDPLILKPKFARFLVDKTYIMSAMGLLASDYPEIAYKIMKKYLIEV